MSQALGFFRRHKILTMVVVLLLVLRAALPAVVRSILASQGSQAINGRLEVADVDLFLLRGGLALQGVAVFAEEGEAEPLLAWNELYVNVRWLPLFYRTVRFDEIRLVEARVDLRRLRDGSINLLNLVPASETTPETEPVSKESGDVKTEDDWNVAVDRLVLTTGDLWFDDSAQPGTERVRVQIDDLRLTDASLGGGVYDGAASFELAARVQEAPLQIRGTLVVVDSGFRIHADVSARDLPVNRAGPYLAALGWSKLRGLLDLDLKYDLDGETGNEIRGTVSLRELAVEVPDLERPALAAKSLTVNVGRIDLKAHRAEVESVRLTGPSLLVHPGDQEPLPLLAAVGGKAPSGPPPDADSSQSIDEKKGSEESWTWSVAEVGLDDGHLLLAAPAGDLDVKLDATARKVSPTGPVFPIEIDILEGEGSIAVKGRAGISPVAFSGTVDWKDLDLPRLAGVSGSELAPLLAGGRTNGSLEVAAGMPVEKVTVGAADVYVSGRLSIDGLAAQEGESEEFAFGWESLNVDVDGIKVPGLLAASGDVPPDPVTVRIARVNLSKPRLRLTRAQSGLLLPAALMGKETAEEPGGPKEETVAAEPETAAGAAPREVRVALGELDLSGGRITFVDQTTEPRLRQRVSSIRLVAKELAWPERRVKELVLSSVGPGKARLEAKAGGSSTDMSLDIALKQLGLKPYHPYASTQSGYGIKRGSASLKSRLRFTEDRYQSESQLRLHDLRVSTKTGGHAFRDRFGVPISLALALLRDQNGEIKLNVPVDGDRVGTRVSLLKSARSALREVLVNALASPLKLLGTVNLFGGKIESFDVAPIPFQAGRADLDPAGEERLKPLASLLAERPGLALHLEGMVGETDVQWLRYKQTLERLDGPDAPPLVLEQTDKARGYIREYLEGRLAGRPVEPHPSVQPVIVDLLSQKKVSGKRLAKLGAERAMRIRDLLVDRAGIDTARIELLDPVGEVAKEGAVVRVEIDAAP